MLEFNQLIWTFVFHIINAIILYFILKRLLFKPVKNFLDRRENKFKSRIKELDDREEKIKQMEEYYKRKIEGAKDEAKAIIDQANRRAKEIISEAQNRAKEEARLIVERGRKQIMAERKQAMDEMREEIARLSVEIASKILERRITLEDNQKIVEEFLERVR